MKDKFFPILGLLAGIAAAGALGLYFVVGSAFSMVRAVDAYLADPLNGLFALVAVSIGLNAAVSVFTISRWWIVADASKETASTLGAIESRLDSVETASVGFNDRIIANTQQLSALTTSFEQSSLIQPVKDEPGEWKFTVKVDAYNGLFKNEVSLVPVSQDHYRVSSDAERVGSVMYERLTEPRIEYNCILFIPEDMTFAAQVSPLIRLGHILRVCRLKAQAADKKFVPPRVFLVNAQRPTPSFFVGYQKHDGQLRRVGLEYFRDLEPGGVDTPTSASLIKLHNNAQIEKLALIIDKTIETSREVDSGTVEDVMSPFLPDEDGGMVVRPSRIQLRAAVKELYARSKPLRLWTVENGDHFILGESGPSRHLRPDEEGPLQSINPADIATK